MSKSRQPNELERLRAELAAAKAPREAMQAVLEESAEIARLTQELSDEPHIAAAVEEHGAVGDAIAVLHTPAGAIIVRRPKGAVWRRFSETAAGMKSGDILTFVKSCLVYPQKADVERIFDLHPAALERVGGMLAELANVKASEAVGK